MAVVARERLVGSDGGEERKSGGRQPDAMRLARGGGMRLEQDGRTGVEQEARSGRPDRRAAAQ